MCFDQRWGLSMKMDGHILTLKWPVDNLDTLLQVCYIYFAQEGRSAYIGQDSFLELRWGGATHFHKISQPNILP